MAVWATYKFYVDWNNDGGFSGSYDDVTALVIRASWEYGRDSASPLEGRSIVGLSNWELDNSDDRFSSYNTASPIYGKILPNRRCKITMKIGLGAEVTKFYGYLETIVPTSGPSKQDCRASLRAHGVLGYLATKNTTVEMHTDITTGEAIGEVLDAVDFPAGQRGIDTGLSTMGRWWEERETDAFTAMRRIENTECGFLREGQDGKVLFEDRSHRLNAPHTTSQATYTNDPVGSIRYTRISQEDPLRGITNKITARVRTFDVSDPTVLWRLAGDPPVIAAGESLTLTAVFPSPTTSPGYLAVESWDMIDVYLNGQADGEGDDLSYYVDITLTKTATRLEIVLANTGYEDVHVVLCQARGIAVVESDPVEITDDDDTSIEQFGLCPYEFPGVFIESIDEAKEFCAHLVSVYKSPIPKVTITLDASVNSSHLLEAQTRDVSDRIHITADEGTSLHIDSDFFVENIRHNIYMRRSAGESEIHTVELLCAAVSGHAWNTSTSSYTPGTVTPPGYNVPDDLWANGIASGLTLIFGIGAWKYNDGITEGELRVKLYEPGTSLESVDLRTPEEGGTLTNNGVTEFIFEGVGATQYGMQVVQTMSQQGVAYFVGRLKNAAGWSVWSDGNITPRWVKDRIATEDPSLADTGPPADWSIAVKGDSASGPAVVSISRPRTNGKKILALTVQLKDNRYGSWRAIDADAGAADTIYDGSAISHTYNKTDMTLTKASGDYGAAQAGDLVLLDVRGGAFDKAHCQWGTIPEGAIDGATINDLYGFRPQFVPTYGEYPDIRVKIVRPPWEWNTEGYLGDEPNRGIWERTWWFPPNRGDVITKTFVTDPIQLPAGLDITNVEARAWFENVYSRSDDDTYSGPGTIGGAGGCIPVFISSGDLIIDAGLGKVFTVTVDQDFTLRRPFGLTQCGQVIALIIVQDETGGWTMDIDEDDFRLGDDVNNTNLSLAPGSRSYLGMVYFTPSDTLDIVSLVRNYQ